ncbi:hypothetical protein CVIRNUC_001963 [Coccomyxa viridis]|uniref:RING-type domain-containing protein n=1 Tax=Coccomyxa viridis TaxID=1274662 RepID=A0AAV1HWC6_9CHLO|nr:hypothetical protein CVIRNUC_001963 [Coccomyxa viridis]
MEEGPTSWWVLSCSIWVGLLVAQKGRLGRGDILHLLWGVCSASVFLHFILRVEPDFKGWGDVYYFCGSDMRFCTCDFKWNWAGWRKAFTLWNFILTTALGLQKLAIKVGLNGLLPGEEVVTKESFVSVCWRLIPYWLNNWEQQWGAECSSMMFELPHFAIELLVVLPCVQILCARLKILALPPGQAAIPPGAAAAAPAQQGGRGALAPDILRGGWLPRSRQAELLPRLKANLRLLAVVTGIAAIAACNALVVPLLLEREIERHGKSLLIRQTLEQGGLAGHNGTWSLNAPSSARLSSYSEAYQAKSCENMDVFQRKLEKHGREIARMGSAEHKELVPLVEVSLAIMRLACEKFFVLISVLATYLLFRDEAPRPARLIIRLNHRLSVLFQRVILYSFPAICWLYGAGILFSSFVSIVFWGASVQQLVESVRKSSTIVRPMGLRDATQEQIERMNNNCAVCWSEMGAPLPRAPMLLMGAGSPALAALNATPLYAPGKSLACGHAFHEACIKQWLAQCHGQGREPTCPMCNAIIELEILYRLPLPWSLRQATNADILAPQLPPHHPVAEPEEAVQPQQQQRAAQHQQEWFDVMEEIAVGGVQPEVADMQVLQRR